MAPLPMILSDIRSHFSHSKPFWNLYFGKCSKCSYQLWLAAWHSGGTPVFRRRIFLVLRL